MKRRFAKRMVTAEVIFIGQMADEKSMTDTKIVKRSLLKIPRNINSIVWNKNEVVQAEEKKR